MIYKDYQMQKKRIIKFNNQIIKNCIKLIVN